MLITESTNHIHLRTLSKALSFSLIAAGVTFSLFVLMHKLIESDLEGIDTPEPIQFEGVLFQDEEIKTITKQPIKPIEPMKEQPRMEVPPLEPIENDIDVFIESGPVQLISKAEFKGFEPAATDRDVRPIVRVPPRYPPDAASRGLEGWVRLSFSINEVGGVEDIEVIDSEPKRIFDRAAKRALARWKYQPQVEQGQAIVRTGLSVMLEFSLEQ